MKNRTGLFAIAAAVGFCLFARADYSAPYLRVSAVAAFGDSQYDESRAPMRLVDGSGMDEYGCHNGYMTDSWMAAVNKTNHWVVFDLGEAKTLQAVKIWNFSSGQYYFRAVKQIDVYVAGSDFEFTSESVPDFTDSSVWSCVAEDQAVPHSGGLLRYAGCDPIAFASPVTARWVGFFIEETWGSDYFGMSEVRFDVPADHVVDTPTAVVGAGGTSATIGCVLKNAGTEAKTLTLRYAKSADGSKPTDGWTSVPFDAAVSGKIARTVEGLESDSIYYYDIAFPEDDATPGCGGYFITGAISVAGPGSFYEMDMNGKTLTFTRPAGCVGVAMDVAYAVSGTLEFTNQLSGVVGFSASSSTVSVEFNAVNNDTKDGDRTVSIAVSSPDVAPSSDLGCSFTIFDDESFVAETVTWNGEGDGESWDDFANWDVDHSPRIVDTVLIDGFSSVESPVGLTNEDVTVKELRMASNVGDSSALATAEASGLTVSGKAVIGDKGSAVVTLSGAENSLQGGFYVGNAAESVGVVTQKIGTTTCNNANFYIGNAGRGTLVVEGGTFDQPYSSSSHIRIGMDKTGEGEVILTGGTLHAGYTLYVGVAGRGRFIQTGGKFSDDRFLHVAENAGSYGYLEVTGGTFSIPRACIIGVSGEGEAYFGGTATVTLTRQFSLGYEKTGSGRVTVDGVKISGTDTDHYVIGRNGRGELYMKGGQLWCKKKGMVIRSAASGEGLVHGWGTLSFVSQAENNGLVIADGEAVERTLDFSECTVAFTNGIDNGSSGTNGWYAVNKGKLTLPSVAVAAAAESEVAAAWGESASDEEIDLVNSARFVFPVGTTKGTLKGSLLAADRSDVPPLGSRTVVGVWDLSFTGTVPADAAVTVDFRYDRAKAPKGVALYRFDADGATWRKLDARLPGGCRARVSVATVDGIYAAVAVKPGFSLAVR